MNKNYYASVIFPTLFRPKIGLKVN